MSLSVVVSVDVWRTLPLVITGRRQKEELWITL